MGYEKLGTLALKCKEYAVACGKRSILETKPLKNLNVKELGVCLPDGTISFQTEQAAKNYSRNICMKQGLVPAAEQREIAILRQKNRILGIAQGNHQSCSLKDFVPHFEKDNLVFEHYHPDLFGKGKTTPVSFLADSSLLGIHNIQEIIAYNSLGQYNKLEKLPSFSRRALAEIEDIESATVEHLALAEEDFMLRSLAYDLPHSNFTASQKTTRKLNRLLFECSSKKYAVRSSKEYPQLAHKLWQENAEQCGLKYSTNMDFSV